MESQPTLGIGTGGLLEALAKEAQEEQQTLLAQARAEAQEIIEKAHREAREFKEDRRAAAESEMASERLRVLGGANLKAADLLLRTKEALLAEAFEDAEVELGKRMEGRDGDRLLLKLIEEALPDLGEAFALEVSLEDLGVVQAFVKERNLQAEVRANAGIRHGAKLVSGDGRLVILNTFDARMERAGTRLRVEVGKLLFNP
jgi:V/A-type H+-transporting ATPase subunit E